MTKNDTWGYKSYDNNWKPAETLVRNLIDIASKGGNYLLNVGPTSEGLIPQPSVERLKAVGAWLRVHGESIYGTSAGPFKRGLPWGRATQKPGRIYLHVFDWPKDGRLVVPLANKSGKAALLAAARRMLPVIPGENGLTIAVPAEPPDRIASVIVLELGEPAQPLAHRVRPGADGSLVLSATEAEIDGSAKLEEYGGVQNIGYWTEAGTKVCWNVDAPAGEFSVEISYACEPGSAGSEFEILAGDQKVTGHVESTGSWSSFKTVPLGRIKIAKAGPAVVAVKPLKMPRGAVMNLRTIRLAKVGG
jgi:alpha-L-fucosidase